MTQIMQQFHVLIRSITVLGNQCGYNFKSPGDNFYESNMVRFTDTFLHFIRSITRTTNIFAADFVRRRNCRKTESRNNIPAGVQYTRYYYANFNL